MNKLHKPDYYSKAIIQIHNFIIIHNSLQVIKSSAVSCGQTHGLQAVETSDIFQEIEVPAYLGDSVEDW